MIDGYKNLLPDSAGNTVALLAQISQQIEGLSNGTHVPITAALAPFSSKLGRPSPPASAVWVNSLWFLSLVISLFCALLAMLQQRWARRYLQLMEPSLGVRELAHVRSFFTQGAERFRMHVTVESIPALLHISVFLFLAGLAISLFTIHHTVAYITLSAVVVCVLVYAAITMMPVVYHDSPYTSPLSTPAWYISRKTAVAVLDVVDWVVDLFRQCKGKFDRWRSAAKNMAIPSLPDRVPFHRPLLGTDMSEAIYDASKRPDPYRDAQNLAWTLEQLHEEGDLLKFAAGIPGYSRSHKIEESELILKETQIASTKHDIYKIIRSLLSRASKPGYLHDSKLLPESVRQQRIKICLEALYYLPYSLENILKDLVDQHDNPRIVNGSSPIMQTVESWLLAERLSVATTTLISPTVKFEARCMVTAIASQPPVDQQSLSILMRHLRIKNPEVFNRYLDQFDSLLLRNLNHFLINTAQSVVEDPEKQHHIDIVYYTVCLATRLKFEHAAQDLRDQFEELRTWFLRFATGPPGPARENAERLLPALNSLTPDPPRPPPSVPPAAGDTVTAHVSPTNVPYTAAAPTSDHPAQISQNPSVQQLSRPVSQVPNDAYISITPSST